MDVTWQLLLDELMSFENIFPRETSNTLLNKEFEIDNIYYLWNSMLEVLKYGPSFRKVRA